MRSKVIPCPECGFFNPAGAPFCLKCGNVLRPGIAPKTWSATDMSTTKRCSPDVPAPSRAPEKKPGPLFSSYNVGETSGFLYEQPGSTALDALQGFDEETAEKMSSTGGFKVMDEMYWGVTQVQPPVASGENPSYIDHEASSRGFSLQQGEQALAGLVARPLDSPAVDEDDLEDIIMTREIPQWEEVHISHPIPPGSVWDQQGAAAMKSMRRTPASEDDFPEIEQVESLPGFDVLEDMPTQEIRTKPYKVVAGIFGDREMDRPHGVAHGRHAPEARPAVASRARQPDRTAPLPLIRMKRKLLPAVRFPAGNRLRMFLYIFLVVFAAFLLVFAVLLLKKSATPVRGGKEVLETRTAAGGKKKDKSGAPGGQAGRSESSPDSGFQAGAHEPSAKQGQDRVGQGTPKQPPGKVSIPLLRSNPLLEKLPKQLYESRVFFRHDRVDYGGATFFVYWPARVFPSLTLGEAIKKDRAIVDVSVGVTGPAGLDSFSLLLIDGSGAAFGPYATGAKFIELPVIKGQIHIFWENVSMVPEGQILFLHRTFLVSEDRAANMILEIGHENIDTFVWIKLEHTMITGNN